MLKSAIIVIRGAIIVLATSSLLISCQDDFCPGHYRCDCLDKMVIPCNGDFDSNYFKGLIRGEQMCIGDGVDVHSYSLTVYNSFTTLPGGISSSNQQGTSNGLYFGIRSPSTKENTFSAMLKTPKVPTDSFSIVSELDKLQFMDTLPLASRHDKEEGYSLQLGYICRKPYENSEDVLNPKFDYVSFSQDTWHYSQPEQAYMRVTKFQKRNLGDSWKYNIDFEIDGIQLYYDLGHLQEFGKVEQAIFSTTSIVPK